MSWRRHSFLLSGYGAGAWMHTCLHTYKRVAKSCLKMAFRVEGVRLDMMCLPVRTWIGGVTRRACSIYSCLVATYTDQFFSIVCDFASPYSISLFVSYSLVKAECAKTCISNSSSRILRLSITLLYEEKPKPELTLN